jgi:hypothetical protein
VKEFLGVFGGADDILRGERWPITSVREEIAAQ